MAERKMGDTVPVLLRDGRIAMVPRADLMAALQDPLAAPVSEVLQEREGTVPVLLEGGGIAQVPPESYAQAVGDPLASGEQGALLVPMPLANGRIAMVPREDAMAAMNDPLSAYGATKPQGAAMNGQQDALDPMTLQILEEAMRSGELEKFFQPFENEEAVLKGQAELAGQLRQPGRERSTPTGAIFGGLSNAIGNIAGAYQQNKALEGQRALGTRMQQDASGRTAALLELLQRSRGFNPKTGLMDTAVGDDELAAIMGGGR
jgi:hypothetical protein